MFKKDRAINKISGAFVMKKFLSFIILFLSVCILFTDLSYAKTQTAISKDGVPISFSVYGKGDVALVFIPGWSCNSSVWKNQVPYFSKKYRVVTLELAGHGKSGNERTVYTMESFAQDVVSVVKQINASKVILIGHSMGGYVIIETAKIIPDNVIALVGIDTLQNLEQSYTPEQVAEFVKPFKADFKNTTDSFVRGMFVQGTDLKLVNEIVDMMSNASPSVGVSAMENMFSTSYGAVNPLNIKTPVWCLNADLWPTNAEINRKYLTQFNLHIMPGVGHFLMLEKPNEFNKQLDEIIKEILLNAKTTK